MEIDVFAQSYALIVVHANIRLALHRQSNYEKFFNYLSINTFYFVINKHTHLTALYLGLPGWAGTRMLKPISILLKQDTVSGSGISWAICKSAPRSSKITTPGPHHSVFYSPDALPATQPTLKALKAVINIDFKVIGPALVGSHWSQMLFFLYMELFLWQSWVFISCL